MESDLKSLERHVGYWKQDPVDTRDFIFKSPEMHKAEILDSVDFRPDMTPVEEQRDIGSCVANAVVGSLEYLYHQKYIRRFCFSPKDYSRLFVYWYARLLEGDTDTDSGTTIRSALKACSKYGVCLEKYWPYEEARVFKSPDEEAVSRASKRTIHKYERLIPFLGPSNDTKANIRDSWLLAMSEGYPIIFGMILTSSFMSVLTAKTGVVNPPQDNDRRLGGHAMLACGYELHKERVIVRNSWGKYWGDEGYCYIPFDYIFSPGVAMSTWIIKAHP